MTVKEKLEELRLSKKESEMDQMIIDSVLLGLIDLSSRVDNFSNANCIILEKSNYLEIGKFIDNNTYQYYLIDTIDGYRDTKKYLIKLPEDFEKHYDELKDYAIANSSVYEEIIGTKKVNQNSFIKFFLMLLSTVIILIGIIGGFAAFDFEIAFIVVLSTLTYAAILLGIWKIISILLENKK
jgi:hypothetical protein